MIHRKQHYLLKNQPFDHDFPNLESPRICFLPDCTVNEENRFFYKTLYTKLPEVASFSIETYYDMPNVYESNTKRYEVQWMTYMRSLRLDQYACVIAHGSSAEALLRYMESDKIQSAVLIDASDVYTAGERHGRAYRYSKIQKHCRLISFISSTREGKCSIYNTFSDSLPDPTVRGLSEGSADVAAAEANGSLESGRRIVQVVTKQLKMLIARL